MIDKRQVYEYLVDFQKRNLPELIKRDLKISQTNKIIAIIGPRRAGKTFFLIQLMKEFLKNGVEKKEMIYLNFEDPRLININFEEIKEVIKIHWQIYHGSGKYLFVDEPQNVNRWEIAIRGIYDEGFKIYISGSSSKLLSKEISTSLRGRSLSYLLLPFSFKEYLKIKNKEFNIKEMGSKEKSELLGLIDNFLDFGGFPEVIKEDIKEEKLRIIESYFELIVFRDIIERYNIKNSKLIKWLIKSIMTSFSKEISINKIYQTLKSQNMKASKNTLYNYFSLLENSFFILIIERFLFSERKKDLPKNKVYLSDSGYVKLIEFSKNLGKKMENAVFLELIRRKRVLEKITYWKNVQQEEADFVINESNKVKSIIQVCYDLDNLETKKREINSLLKASKELKCKNLIIITFDYEGEENHEWFGIKGKIKFIPLWKWLL